VNESNRSRISDPSFGSTATKADQMAASVGGGLSSMAGTLRHNVPVQGVLGDVAENVARSLERGGQYLQSEGLTGLAADVGRIVRRHPVETVLACIGLGYFVAKATSRR